MENTPSKIRISIRDGILEVEGSEEFVSKQIDVLKDLIVKAAHTGKQPAGGTTANSAAADDDNKEKASPDATPPADTAAYENLYSFDGGVVKILKDLPGADNAKKTVNGTLLFLFGKSLLGQEPEASFKDLRQVCKDHGCLDSTNFAATIKDEKSHLTVSGSGKSQSAKLTVPGKRFAKALADQNTGAAV